MFRAKAFRLIMHFLLFGDLFSVLTWCINLVRENHLAHLPLLQSCWGTCSKTGRRKQTGSTRWLWSTTCLRWGPTAWRNSKTSSIRSSPSLGKSQTIFIQRRTEGQKGEWHPPARTCGLCFLGSWHREGGATCDGALRALVDGRPCVLRPPSAGRASGQGPSMEGRRTWVSGSELGFVSWLLGHWSSVSSVLEQWLMRDRSRQIWGLAGLQEHLMYGILILKHAFLPHFNIWNGGTC